MPRSQPRPFRPTVVRYHLPDGSRCKAGTPGAVRTEHRLDTYYCKLGKDKISLKTTDEGKAWEELRRLLKRRAEGKAGLRDEYTDHAERPIEEHVAAWCDFLKAKGSGKSHIEDVRRDVLRVAVEAGWGSLSDLTAESCLRAADRLAEKLGHHARMRNHVISHCKQFSRWCSRHGRLRGHVLDALSPRPVEDDLRHERRCPTDEEVSRLWAYLYGARARERVAMSGPCRALAYKVAMAAGLRAGELRSLERASFDLEGATVTVDAAYDKRRRKVTLPLPPWLVGELREWFAKPLPAGPLFPFPRKNPGRTLYADLLAAGVPISVPGPDGKPQFFDMHALRVWYCTRMAEIPGMDIKTLMDLCRHSTPTLTLRVYAKGDKARREAAAKALPPPGQGQPQPDAESVPPAVAPEDVQGGPGESRPVQMPTPERPKKGRGRSREKDRASDPSG